MPRISALCAAAAIGCADGLAAMNRVGVVFDIDGTLADSFRLGFDATNVVLQRNAFPPISEADYHDNCIYVTPERMARHAVGEHDEDLGKRLGGEFDREYIALVSTETAGFYPGLRPLLERLRDSGAVLGALTNAAVAYAEAVLLVNNARGAFGSVHGADSVERAKPFPDGCLRVASDLGLEPGHCIYVGDAPTDGAARAAGLRVCRRLQLRAPMPRRNWRRRVTSTPSCPTSRRWRRRCFRTGSTTTTARWRAW